MYPILLLRRLLDQWSTFLNHHILPKRWKDAEVWFKTSYFICLLLMCTHAYADLYAKYCACKFRNLSNSCHRYRNTHELSKTFNFWRGSTSGAKQIKSWKAILKPMYTFCSSWGIYRFTDKYSFCIWRSASCKYMWRRQQIWTQVILCLYIQM